jgi:hypothetical protein
MQKEIKSQYKGENGIKINMSTFQVQFQEAHLYNGN